MKKNVIFLLFVLLLVPLVQAHRYYGQGLYDNGNYGANTPPTVITYEPSELVVSRNYTSINLTFNITVIDYDLDALSHNWTVNGTSNSTFVTFSHNLSILLNMTPATYNITVNVSDNLSHVFVSWILNITNITIGDLIFINISIEDYGIEWISFNWTGDLTEIHYSEDNISGWKNVTTINLNTRKANQVNLQSETLYYFRAEDTELETVYLSQKTKSLRESDQFYNYIISGILFMVLLFLGYYLDDAVFKLFAGLIPLLIAVNITNDGFGNITNVFFSNSLIALLMGIGAYFMISPSIRILEGD